MEAAADAASDAPSAFFNEQIKAGLADLAEQSLKFLWPDKIVGCPPVGKYDAAMHARVCRAKMFGLSDRAVARSVGVSFVTLSNWRKRHAGLDADMNMAAEMANEHAAILLRKLMHGDGPTAFQSIKFFLRTHSPEFQEKQRVEIQVDHKETIRLIRENLYGLGPSEASASLSGDVGGGPALPVVDVEAAEKDASGAFAPLSSAVAALPGPVSVLPVPSAPVTRPLNLSDLVGVDPQAAQAVRLQPEETTMPAREPWD